MDPNALVNDIRSYLAMTNNQTFPDDESRKELLSAAQSLCRRLERPMETLLRVSWVEPAHTACLKIGIDIGLFSVFEKRAQGSAHTIDELALETNTDNMLLERILRMLASMGTVDETGPGSFSGTRLSHALTVPSCSSAVDYRYLIANPAFQHLPKFLQKTNYQNPSDLLKSPWQYALATDASFFEWIGSNPEALEMFTNHMAGYTSQRGTWEDVYPIQDRILDGLHEDELVLVDLGGGSGHDLKRFAASFATAVGDQCLVLQDLPEVIEAVKEQDSLPPAITPVPIDLTKDMPVPGSRAYYLHSVLHDWPDSEVRNILKKMHQTLLQPVKGGRKPKLLINENVLLKQGVPPQPAALDLIMMAAFASHERSEEQWRRLLESAGYRIIAIYSKAGVDEAVIEAEAVYLGEQFVDPSVVAVQGSEACEQRQPPM